MPELDPRVRALLVCPKCRGDLVDDAGGLVCPPCALVYPVVGGVPHLLPELATRSERVAR